MQQGKRAISYRKGLGIFKPKVMAMLKSKPDWGVNSADTTSLYTGIGSGLGLRDGIGVRILRKAKRKDGVSAPTLALALYLLVNLPQC